MKYTLQPNFTTIDFNPILPPATFTVPKLRDDAILTLTAFIINPNNEKPQLSKYKDLSISQSLQSLQIPFNAQQHLQQIDKSLPQLQIPPSTQIELQQLSQSSPKSRPYIPKLNIPPSQGSIDISKYQQEGTKQISKRSGDVSKSQQEPLQGTTQLPLQGTQFSGQQDDIESLSVSQQSKSQKEQSLNWSGELSEVSPSFLQSYQAFPSHRSIMQRQYRNIKEEDPGIRVSFDDEPPIQRGPKKVKRPGTAQVQTSRDVIQQKQSYPTFVDLQSSQGSQPGFIIQQSLESQQFEPHIVKEETPRKSLTQRQGTTQLPFQSTVVIQDGTDQPTLQGNQQSLEWMKRQTLQKQIPKGLLGTTDQPTFQGTLDWMQGDTIKGQTPQGLISPRKSLAWQQGETIRGQLPQGFVSPRQSLQWQKGTTVQQQIPKGLQSQTDPFGTSQPFELFKRNISPKSRAASRYQQSSEEENIPFEQIEIAQPPRDEYFEEEFTPGLVQSPSSEEIFEVMDNLNTLLNTPSPFNNDSRGKPLSSSTQKDKR